MKNEKKKGGRYLRKRDPKLPGKGFAIPFFVTLFALTVVSFIIPLRPTQSMDEKRNLAEFPEFSLEALVSGDYFDDITLWFSDTYPGRDKWISLAASTKELHGIQDVKIYGDVQLQETVPLEFDHNSSSETRPPETEPPATQPPATDPLETQAPVTEPPETEPPETTPPTEPVEEWGGVNAGEGADIYLGSVIQVGDTAFNYFRFSQNQSDKFVNTMNWYAEAMADHEDLNVVTVLFPTAVGVMVEPEYQEKIGCTDQGQVIDYIFSGITEDIVKVDLFDTLVEHNDEYLYFRTDHHWTALAGYYCYRDTMLALGKEPKELDYYEEWDQGKFRGSNYYKCNQSSKLTLDNVFAYNPPGDITMMINSNEKGRFSWPLLTDMSKSKEGSKYMCFLAGDHALCEITNNDLPDGPTCVLVKDSYGNCVAPFFVADYHKVYVVDYREYRKMNMKKFADAYDVDDMIFLIQVAAAQDNTYNGLIRTTAGY